MKRTYLVLAVACTLLAIVLVLALRQPRASTTPQQDPEVAVTIFPLYDIVRNVAGDAVSVSTILPPGADPHTFEPTPATVAAINESRVIYRVGYGLDDWATRIANAQTDVLPLASEDISLRTLAGNVDPHYWLTIPNAKLIATLAAQDLSSHFPAYRNVFSMNLATYLTKLDAADAQIRTMIAGMENKNIVTVHDAWYYFAQEYGLTVVGTFAPESAEEPTPQQLTNLSAALRAANVHTLFIEANESTNAVQSFANDNGLALLTIDAESTTSASYIDLMLHNAETLSKNQ